MSGESTCEGLWRSEGYGWLLQIGARGYERWQLAAGGAYCDERGSAADFAEGFEQRPASTLLPTSGSASDALCLRHAGEITDYLFHRLPELPQACRADYWSRDPRRSFDVFCRLFGDHYPFFELRGLDWRAVCHEASSRIRVETPPEQLFDLLTGLVAPLEDNHVDLVAKDPAWGQRSFKSDKIAALRHRIDDQLGVDRSVGDFWAAMKRLQPIVAQDLLQGVGSSACNGLVHWGRLADGVGYLAVLRMFGFADTAAARAAQDLPRHRVAGARFLQEDLKALSQALDEALAELAPCRSLVLDVRMNGGGFDRAALEIASRFTERSCVAFTKKAVREGVDAGASTTTGEKTFTGTQDIELSPSSGSRYRGPVFLLISPRTGSAAEILVLAMMALPQVTRVGEPTIGILSDNLYKRLPNGWELGLSNEVYEAVDGKCYEGTGIPPEVAAPVWSADDLRSGYRVAVRRALELAGVAPRR